MSSIGSSEWLNHHHPDTITVQSCYETPNSVPRSESNVVAAQPLSQSISSQQSEQAAIQVQQDRVPSYGPPIGWFKYDLPSGFMKPRPIKEISSDPSTPADTYRQPSLLTKADLRSTLATNLAPKSGVLPSQNANGTSLSAVDVDTDSDEEKGVRSSTPISISPVAENTVEARAPAPLAARIGVSMMTSQPLPPNTDMTLMRPPLGRPPSARKVVPTYVLPDGTVRHSGKGLGRGRPGIKRGPRKSKLSTEITADSPQDPIPIPVPSTPPSSLATTASRKRQRTDSSASEDVSTHSRSTSSTPEYTGPQSTQTRSGRQTQKPSTALTQYSPTPDQLTNSSPTFHEPATKKHQTSKPSTPISHPKIKRRIYRGREAFALCEHCLRGHGPTGNAIVFCDACNKCWHQKCHEPQIPREIVVDKNAEWLCRECDEILHPAKKSERKKGKKGKGGRKSTATLDTPTPTPAPPVANLVPTGLVGGNFLSRPQRLAQLTSLPKDRLIDLLMRAADLAPALPLFEDPNPVPPPPPPHASTDEDEGFEDGEEWEYVLDENALLYPKPGNGVKLPPDSVDLNMLLEGEECGTFSHWVARSGVPGPFEESA